MGQPLDTHIRTLQELYWSEADPEGRGFVPLADALRRVGDHVEAHRILRDGLKRHPDFLAGHVVFGWLALDQGKIEEAESRFRAALELDPDNLAALKALSDIFLERGEVSAALPLLEKLEKVDPTDRELPSRVREVRARLETLPQLEPPESSASLPSQAVVWDDPVTVAEELDWSGATLQQDSAPSSAEPGDDLSAPLPVAAAAVVEDGEPLPEQGALEEAILTPTLGEIYLRQGLLGRAESVFLALLERDPGNGHLRSRLGEVRSLMGTRDREGPLPVREAEPAEAEVEIEEKESEDAYAELPPETMQIVPIESLAPDRIRPAFAGVVRGEAAPAVPEGSVPIESLAPEGPVPIESLAPEGPVPIESLAPEGPVPVESLAPEGPVPIESLAPEGPVPVESLAPEGTGQQDSTLESFERWLDNLQ